MLCFVFSALVALLDQLFKRWITISLPNVGDTMELIPGVIGLTYVRNDGAAFGILSGQWWLLVIVMFVCIALLVFILLRYNEGFWGTLGLSSVLGGAVGNFIDRVSLRYVVDMFEVEFVNFAIFNIADVFITLGALTFVIFFILSSLKSGKKAISGSGAELDDHARRMESLYDDYPAEPNEPARGQFANRAPITSIAEYAQRHAPTPVSSMPEAPAPAAPEEPGGFSPLLDQLGSLELDITKMDMHEEKDMDDLLREYGFESNDY